MTSSFLNIFNGSRYIKFLIKSALVVTYVRIFNTIPAVIASNDGKYLNTIPVENLVLLFTAKQGLCKYNVKKKDVRLTRNLIKIKS